MELHLQLERFPPLAWLETEIPRSGPGCSKLTTSLVNVSLKFQKLISQIRQYFLLFFFAVLKLLSFFQQKISAYLVIKL